jgi:molybdopterin-binding protein
MSKKIPALGIVDGVNVIHGKVKAFEQQEDGERIEVIIVPKETKEEQVVGAFIGRNLFDELGLKKGAEVYAEIHPLEVIIKPVPK